MTEVADGNSIRMSAPQEVLPLDGPEGFGSGNNLSACSNATLDRPVNCTADQAKEADIPEVIASQTGIQPGDSVAHIDKETSPLKRVEGGVVEEVAKAGETSPLLDVQDVKGSAGGEHVEAEPIEENHVKVDVSETIPARENDSNVEAMAVEMPVTEDLKADENAAGKESSTGEAEMDGRQNTGTGNIGVEASVKAKTLEEGQETLPSAAITQDEGQQANGDSEVVKEETKLEEIRTVTDADKASTNLPCEVHEEVRNQPDDLTDRIANEMANKLTEDMAFEMADEVAGRLREEMAEKMTDEMADRMADEMADRMADEMVDRMADEMADKMADEMADKMADEMADKMAAEMADELADEMADEVLEGQYGMGEEGQGNENMEVGETNEVEDMEEEEEVEEVEEDGQDPIDDNGEGTVDEQMAFVEELERFFKQRKLEYKAPKFYGLELNVLKLWRVVTRLGGYEHVTVSKLWRTVGEEFKPPKTCTTISWSFRGFYEKALLDYERFKTGIPVPGSSQRGGQMDGPYLVGDNQGTVSPATPSSQPNAGGVSGSGRARRDAAARAMQGWHSQRMGNGDAKDPNSKEKISGGKHVKKEKKLTNIGGNGLKRKGTTTVLERAVKAVRAKGRPRLHEESPPSISAVVNTGKRSIKQQDSMRRPVKVPKLDGVGGFDPPIVDEGPKADWVKINVHKHLDCFEIYALVPGLAREEVRIQCEPGGRLVIAGMPEDPENPWGVTPFRKVISLPSRIDAHQTSAVVTLYGQLYVRVPIAEDKST